MLVVVVTGPPGAGKSTTATTAHDALGDAGVPNALIDVDQLERAYPPVEPARALRHLATLAASYREAGHDLLFVPATLETDADRRAALAAIDADDHLLVRLEAHPDTLVRRIRAREPATWGGLEEFVASAVDLAPKIPAELPDADLVIDTDHTSPDDAAREIIRAAEARRLSR